MRRGQRGELQLPQTTADRRGAATAPGWLALPGLFITERDAAVSLKTSALLLPGETQRGRASEVSEHEADTSGRRFEPYRQ